MVNTMKKLILIFGVCMLFVFGGCVAYPQDNNEYIGFQYNAWNNTATGVNGLSNIVDTLNNPFISIFIETGGNTDLGVLVSEDCVNFNRCDELSVRINTPSGNSAHIFFTAGARCYRLRSSNNVIMNASIIAKR
jgi:hypothetical protein